MIKLQDFLWPVLPFVNFDEFCLIPGQLEIMLCVKMIRILAYNSRSRWFYEWKLWHNILFKILTWNSLTFPWHLPLFRISLTFPWPWKNKFFPDFSLTRGNPVNDITQKPQTCDVKLSSLGEVPLRTDASYRCWNDDFWLETRAIFLTYRRPRILPNGIHTPGVMIHEGTWAVAQQTHPVQTEVCQASPHLDPVTSPGCGSCSSLLSLAAFIWIGSVAGSPADASTKGLLLRCRSLSRSICRQTKTIDHECPGLTLLGRCWRFRASLVVFGLLNKSHRWSSHSVCLVDGPDSVL